MLFDWFVSNPDVNSYPLEMVSVPTLFVHARDDSLASYDAAVDASNRVPGARLVSLQRGGHLMLAQREATRLGPAVLGNAVHVTESPVSA